MQHLKVNLDELIEDPSWFPESFDSARGLFSFVHTDRRALASEPFLDHRWNRAGLHNVQVPVDAIAGRLASFDTQPRLHFIWHTSFCCSSVIARALDRAGRNLSLLEPAILVNFADAKREALSGRKALPPLVFELALRLLARPFEGDAQVAIKPSNFANVLLQDAARVIDGNSLFLYSDIERFLLSIAKGGMHLRRYARRLFSGIVGDRGEKLPWSVAEIIGMSDLEIAAIAWHLQIAEFQRSRALFGQGRAATLNCDRFLADPLGTLVRLDRFFELGIGETDLEQLVGGPLLRSNAKRPGFGFDTRQSHDEYEAVRRSLGNELNEIIDWSYRACPGTARGELFADAD